MSTTPTEPSPEQQNPNPPQPDGQRDATDEPLREPGLKALQQERERGDRLESELNNLKPLREQFDALKAVFGDKTEGATPEDIVKTLQDEVRQMRHDTLVLDAARRFGITEDADLDLLRGAASAEQMQRLAERLKPAPAAPPAPQADPGQGARNGASVEDAEYAQFYPSR